jgi:hypothetical protein
MIAILGKTKKRPNKNSISCGNSQSDLSHVIFISGERIAFYPVCREYTTVTEAVQAQIERTQHEK